MKLINDEGRTCTGCGEFKTWDWFSTSNKKHSPYNKAAKCKPCQRTYDQEKRKQIQAKAGITEDGRVCTKCDIYKPWADFPPRGNAKNNMHPRTCLLCLDENRKAHNKKAQDLKHSNWHLWQARALRSRWLARFKKMYPERDTAEVPTRAEIEAWLHSEPMQCYFTGVSFEGYEGINFDHLQPVSRGGSFALTNVKMVCATVNRIKGEMNETEFNQLQALMASWEDNGLYLQNMLRRATMIFTPGKRKRKGKN